MANAQKPISYFSESICRKIPEFRRPNTSYNARWILRNPVRLTSSEKQEVLAVALSTSEQEDS